MAAYTNGTYTPSYTGKYAGICMTAEELIREITRRERVQRDVADAAFDAACADLPAMVQASAIIAEQQGIKTNAAALDYILEVVPGLLHYATRACLNGK